jgi:hypothetical protein
MLSGEYFRRLEAAGVKGAHDCDFCERRSVRCYALDQRLVGREDTRGDVTVEPAWMCRACFMERATRP